MKEHHLPGVHGHGIQGLGKMNIRIGLWGGMASFHPGRMIYF